MLPPHLLHWAEQRAERLGIGADRALISAGHLDEDTYVQALAANLGVSFEPLETVGRSQSLLSDDDLIGKVASGLLPIADRTGHEAAIVFAPRGTGARGLTRLIAGRPESAARFRLTTTARFNRFVLRIGGGALHRQAADGLKGRWPALSAASRWGVSPSAATLGAVLLTAGLLTPLLSLTVAELMLSAIFLTWLGLRLTGAFVGPPPPLPGRELSDRDLPIYSVIAAVYREANSVGSLLAAIERLDYPAEKLDVIVAVEADDRETRAALAAAKTRLPITVIDVPPGEPRTKPKALNVALPFARGTFTVIYDAEDRPDPGQLRLALRAFGHGGSDLACVQARLCIDNTYDGWLARYFTADYAGQFDVFLPGLARWRVPLPLGGSSNHFHGIR